MTWLVRSTSKPIWDKKLEQAGVFRLEQPLPFGMRTTNMYLCMGPPKVLIDGGFWFPECLEALRKNLAILDTRPEEICHVFLTHAHVDHVGVAISLAKHYGTKVWAHPGEAVRLDGRQAIFLSDYLPKLLLRLGVERNTAREMVVAFEAPIRLYGLQVLDRFEPLIPGHRLPIDNLDLEILHTPGHSQGSVCFIDRKNRFMFSGDTLTPVGPPMIVLSADSESTFSFDGLMALERSLEVISVFKMQLVLSGHGPPTEFQDLEKVAKTSFHARRMAVLKSLDSGLTPFDLALKKTNTDKTINLLMQLFDTRTSLEALMREGKVRFVTKDGVEIFSPY